ncbi:phosphoadenosine phosphosulfate reductase family protein [Pseudodesulfovibrio tunisiensis]|uniref:phosphoadenosine phosphosulfate reductase family protein n=1 Tax=Pseudodesulfovibrio tunisiensis TaxID=463192 RepID=UPI00311ECE3A
MPNHPATGHTAPMPTCSLDNRIQQTEEMLLSLCKQADPQAIRVAWTGGKDSTALLFLWKAVLDHLGSGAPRAINLDTGCKFPEIIEFRDALTREWNVDLHIARPAISLKEYPLAQDKVSCCRDLKIIPLQRAIRDTSTRILITGIRRDENPDRHDRDFLENRTDPDHVLANPLLDWTEMDIWAFHDRFGLPRCSLYAEGYRSLGCMPCTTLPAPGQGERSGRSRAKEQAMRTLTNLGYF